MKQIRTYFETHLADKYDPQELKSLLFWTLEELTGKTRTELLLCKDTEFSAEIQEKVKKIAERLADFEPIQYIFGHTDFCGHPFEVNPHVLIPRPETAELVDKILRENPESQTKKADQLRVLDIGTGSGCIAISLKAARPQWQVSAVDKSPEALSVARKNADKNDVFIDFIEADILKDPWKSLCDWEHADLIVSNPPYICQQEQVVMEKNVLDYEPREALFVPDDDPLLFYRVITQHARQHLTEGGQLYFEVNALYGKEVIHLLEDAGFDAVDLEVDFFGSDRFVAGRWKSSMK